MRVHNQYQPPRPLVDQGVQHGLRIWEHFLVPREHLLGISMLNIQPDGVTGYFVLEEVVRDLLCLPLGVIVPLALMVTQDPVSWHWREPSQQVLLIEDHIGGGAGIEEEL